MSRFIDLSIYRRNRNFAFLFTGQFISFAGTMITSVALPFQVYHETRSTLMVGLLSLVQLIPILFTALLGGVFADRYHRRVLLFTAESVLAVGCLLLAWNATLTTPYIWLIFCVAALMSAFNGLHRPALESIVQQIVDEKDFGTVGSLSTFKYSISMIGGPALGGLLIATHGIAITYFVDMMTFLFSLFCLFMMSHIPKPDRTHDDTTLQSLKAGVRYAMSRQELIGTYVVDFIAMIFGMPSALFPAIAHSYGGVKVLGLLYAAPAVGALVISFYGNWTRFRRHGLAISIAAVLWGLSIIAFGLVSNLYAALFFLAAAGAFDGISGIYRSVMWNQTIPNHLRGRLAGIEMISYLSGPKLGDTEAGLVAAAFGITASIVSGGALCVAGVGICCLFLPKFIQYRAK
nr:Transmembrane secretion effector [uncultured bacterium]